MTTHTLHVLTNFGMELAIHTNFLKKPSFIIVAEKKKKNNEYGFKYYLEVINEILQEGERNVNERKSHKI